MAAFIETMKGETTPPQRIQLLHDFLETNPTPQQVEEFYDAWGPNYDIDMKHVSYQNPKSVGDELASLGVDKSASILDVGAGTGEGGKKLADAGFKTIDGLDGSPLMLEKAKELGVYGKLFCQLVGEEPLADIPDNTYDVIVSSGSFYPYHMNGKCLPTLVRAVRPKGHLVLSSCPHSDEGVGLRPAVYALKDSGSIAVLKEEYIPKWYVNEDGTMYVLQKN
eukprot:TRINITY_DN10570_c0_g1_i1.p1 TRINITY_DN10570_c0_g1~~TRINITY_DN10570_c0_g1_i1.p1  ORF type:complete len:222 (+),score=62.37 TRINITY_DN10570_c0_g1_i1:69-734(+)